MGGSKDENEGRAVMGKAVVYFWALLYWVPKVKLMKVM